MFMIVDGVLIMKTGIGLSRLLYRVFWVELSPGYCDTNLCGYGCVFGIDLLQEKCLHEKVPPLSPLMHQNLLVL